MTTEMEEQLRGLAESQANVIQELRRELTSVKGTNGSQREKLKAMDERLAHHTVMHALLLKWLRENNPDLFQKALMELNLAEQ